MCSISVGQVALIYWPPNTESAPQRCTSSVGTDCQGKGSTRRVIATTNMVKQTMIIGWGGIQQNAGKSTKHQTHTRSIQPQVEHFILGCSSHFVKPEY
jgi:hypothetical protein